MALFFTIAFLASTVGAICGIGGGVIIKPVLDWMHMESTAAVNFLSGCTVLSMSCYSVLCATASKSHQVETKMGVPLIAGAVLGGLGGHKLFQLVQGLFENQNRVSAVQSVCLALITLGTLLYELKKKRIETRRTESVGRCAAIGLGLGMTSSFLGIGGGPINLVVLSYFFSMDTKTAATNSLYIILFSQMANLLTSVLSATVPAFRPVSLAVMIAGGILGSILGRAVNRQISAETVGKLFIGLMAVIICISVYNAWQYVL